MKLLRGTPENIASVDAATRKMLADAKKEEAKSWFIKAAGTGTRAGLILAGAGALLYGAASFFPPKPAPLPRPAERQITLVLPASPAKEAPPPAPKSKASPAPESQRPSPAQLKPSPESKSIVNFVIFREKQHAKGEVQTGGQFENSTQALPSKQWCLYTEQQADGTVRDIELGHDGKKNEPLNQYTFPNVDLNAAYSLCDWWPTAPAPSPHASND